jgi:hypothetical protein
MGKGTDPEVFDVVGSSPALQEVRHSVVCEIGGG